MARRPVHIPKTALTSKKRAALRASDFAVPSERKYPINDLFHARLALTYVLTPSNAAYRDEVVRAVMARYPELQFWWAARSRGLAAKRVRKATNRRMPGRRMVANPHDEWMDEYELAREQERKARAALFRSLGPNVGSNADWADPAYQLDRKRFLVDSEDGTLVIVKRGRWNPRGEYYEDADIERFDTAAEAAAWLKAQGLRSNPRRKLPKSGEGKGIVSRAERGLGTKYRTMREGMLLEGGDVMLLPHRLPGHEGKRMTDLSEAGREWDYEYNDAKPILDLLAASKAPMLRMTTVAKKLKEEGMSVDEVFRGFAFLRSHGLLKQPRDGYVALTKANPRREVETEEYFAALEPTRAKYAERGPEELVLMRSRAAKMLRKYAGKPDRDVAKALGLDPHDPAVLRQIMLMREHPVLTNPRPAARAKRTGSRTAAQSNAAKAMRLFHSGQASSLAEAWDMLRRR